MDCPPFTVGLAGPGSAWARDHALPGCALTRMGKPRSGICLCILVYKGEDCQAPADRVGVVRPAAALAGTWTQENRLLAWAAAERLAGAAQLPDLVVQPEQLPALEGEGDVAVLP